MSMPGFKKPFQKPNLANISGFIGFAVLFGLFNCGFFWMRIARCCQMNTEWENN